MPNMLNVIYDASVVTNVFYKDSNRSGVFFVAYNILNELSKRKDVNLYLYFSPETYADGAELKRLYYPECDCVQKLEKYAFLRKVFRKFRALYASHTRQPVLKYVFAVPLAFCITVFSLVNRIDKGKVERCNAFFSPFFKIPKFVRKFQSVKPFVMIYDLIPLIFPDYYKGRKPFVSIVMENSKKGDSFIFDSLCAKNDALRFFPSVVNADSSVIPLAANDAFVPIVDGETINRIRRKYGVPEGEKYVFSLCSLEPRKNLIRAVKAFLIFLEKNHIDDIVWVMGGSAWDSFAEALKKEGLAWNSETIIRAGYVDDEDLPALYSNAEWFVYTSQYEGFGLPPLEAMKCGCPVITSNNSSLPEVVGDAGIMIDWNSDEQHVKAYERYYFDEPLCKENSRKGLERAKMFSWGKTVDKLMESFYEAG